MPVFSKQCAFIEVHHTVSLDFQNDITIEQDFNLILIDPGHLLNFFDDEVFDFLARISTRLFALL